MELVIDTSALIAVIVAEPERDTIIEITKGNTLIGPGSIPWEIGNAFSAMFKQNRVSMKEADKGIQIFDTIRFQYDISKRIFLKFCIYPKKTTCTPMTHIFLTARYGIKHLY